MLVLRQNRTPKALFQYGAFLMSAGAGMCVDIPLSFAYYSPRSELPCVCTLVGDATDTCVGTSFSTGRYLLPNEVLTKVAILGHFIGKSNLIMRSRAF